MITDIDFKMKEDDKKEVIGIEHSGIHHMLKKLFRHEKTADVTRPQLGAYITQLLTEEIVSHNFFNVKIFLYFILFSLKNGFN